jgi:vacuole morphology and inheritance protein 14
LFSNEVDQETRATALSWINEFILLAREEILSFTPAIVHHVLPSLSSPAVEISGIAQEANANLFSLISETTSDFNIAGTVDTLQHQFLDESERTRIASVEWLLMLHRKSPQTLFGTDDATFATLLKTLSDASEEVVKRDLQLLSQIANASSDDTFQNFLVQLLSLFSSDRRLLDTRGSLIIRNLSLSLSPERIFRCFAEVLERDIDDFEFCSVMVQYIFSLVLTLGI